MNKKQWRAYAKLLEERCLVLRALDMSGAGAANEERRVAGHPKRSARTNPHGYNTSAPARRFRATHPASYWADAR